MTQPLWVSIVLVHNPDHAFAIEWYHAQLEAGPTIMPQANDSYLLKWYEANGMERMSLRLSLFPQAVEVIRERIADEFSVRVSLKIGNEVKYLHGGEK